MEPECGRWTGRSEGIDRVLQQYAVCGIILVDRCGSIGHRERWLIVLHAVG